MISSRIIWPWPDLSTTLVSTFIYTVGLFVRKSPTFAFFSRIMATYRFVPQAPGVPAAALGLFFIPPSVGKSSD